MRYAAFPRQVSVLYFSGTGWIGARNLVPPSQSLCCEYSL